MNQRKNSNVSVLLENRRISSGSRYRINRQIARKLVCKPEAKFVKVWENQSKHPISFESDRLFFDNFRTSYCLNGFGSKPSKTYQLATRPANQRIEDTTLAAFPLETLPLDNRGWRPCLLALSQDNYLTRYDLDTGETLEKVFLSSHYKFRHLTWNNLGHSVVLKSVHLKSPLSHRQLTEAGRESPTVLLAIAQFDLYPLRFVGLAEITKKVFGKDLIDVDVTEGMLFAMHQNNLFKVYSWEDVLHKSLRYRAALGENCDQLDGGVVGCKPAGLPLNMIISECPSVLFEVRCQNHSLSFGGLPWHYIISPPRRQGQFHVYSVTENKLAKNGTLDMERTSVEPDKCFFHFDDSNRVIHMGPDEVRVFRLTSRDKERVTLNQEHSIALSKVKVTQEQDVCQERITASGRVVRVKSYDDSYPLETIQDVSYEDELDLLVVTAVYPGEGDQSFAMVCLHDNETGQLLKEVPLDEPWKPFCRHTLVLDVGRIVHITDWLVERKFECSVYQLDLRPEEVTAKRTSKRLRDKQSNEAQCVDGVRRRSQRRSVRNTSRRYYGDGSDDEDFL